MKPPPLLFTVLCAFLAPALRAADPSPAVPTDRPVTYEAFGAVGDGVADDLPAIVEAHAFANTHGLPVSVPARRHLPPRSPRAHRGHRHRHRLGHVEVHHRRHRRREPPASLFAVRSLLEPVTLSIRAAHPRPAAPRRAAAPRLLGAVENSRQRRYIRRGLNQNNGSPQRDCFILRRDGTIEGAIDWDYDTITRVEARPMDERPLVLERRGLHHHRQPHEAGQGLQLLGAQHLHPALEHHRRGPDPSHRRRDATPAIPTAGSSR
jgi:hypothetical protein